MNRKEFIHDWGILTVIWNEADKAEMTQIRVYDTIGKDPWTGSGMSDKDFAKALDAAPTDRDLAIHINSRGGDVHMGLTMRANLYDWKVKNKRKVVTVIDGIAASTASWFSTTVSDEVHARKSSQVFVHDAVALIYGNADDHRSGADNLDKTSEQICDMYADRAGGGKKKIREMMRNSTLLTGEEAVEIGIVDKIIDENAVRNFSDSELSFMRERLNTIYNSVAKRGGEEKKDNKMNKKNIIALLNAHGVKEWEGKPITEETSEAHLVAALNLIKVEEPKPAEKKPAEAAPKTENALTAEEIAKFRKEYEAFNKLRETEARNQITRDVDQLIIDDKLDKVERDITILIAAGDPEKGVPANREYLNVIAKRNPIRVSQPLPLIDLIGNSIHEIERAMLDNGPRFTNKFIGQFGASNGQVGEATCKEISRRSMFVGNLWKNNRKMLLEMLNTNSIDAGLQRQIILQEMLEEFRVVLLPFQYFSTVFSNVPLEGTDEVDVPFFPLAVGASNSWSAASGYNSASNTTTNTRPVVIGGSGVNSGSSAAANTAKDRKWRAVAFSSYELSRQPYLNYVKLAVQEANKLAVDIFSDVVGRVITATNYGAPVATSAAPQWTSKNIADMWEAATGRNWPNLNRVLTLDHRYNTPLLKDADFKQYLSYGSTDPIRKAKIQEAYGFEDIPIVPNLASYSPAGENLVGWINHISALLFASAPIMPAPAVRALLIRYDVVAHPDIGVAFEYRRFGDTTLDVDKETIECSYGANKGVASALGRITSA